MELRSSIKINQQTNISPRLQQSVKILQMSQVELLKHIEEEIINNPVLSLEIDLNKGYKDYSNTTSNYSSSNNYTHSDHNAWLENQASEEDEYQVLTKNLMEQITVKSLDFNTAIVIEHIISNLDFYGFRTESIEEISQECSVSKEFVEHVLYILRDFEPSGIGTANSTEFLLFQLDNLGKNSKLSSSIINNHLTLVAKKQFSKIAELEEVTLIEVNKAVSIIKSLKPYPLLNFQNSNSEYIHPDIIFKYDTTSESFTITLCDDEIPNVKISSIYEKMASKNKTNKSEELNFIRNKISDGSWLIRSIEQRKKTMRKVALKIAELQHNFLIHGPNALAPLTMKELAESLEVHESTISRVANSKYIETSHGIFELKFIFNQSVKGKNNLSNSNNVNAISNIAVKNILKELVTNEPKNRPLSDQDLVKCLFLNYQLEISRRTVAKYRDELEIPASHLRKL